MIVLHMEEHSYVYNKMSEKVKFEHRIKEKLNDPTMFPRARHAYAWVNTVEA